MKHEHIVEKGQTLSRIATIHKTTVDELMRLNKDTIKNRHNIKTGQRIILPSTEQKTATPPSQSKREHIVQSGDSLSKIAKMYKASLKEIIKLNKIRNPQLIRPGQHIALPPEGQKIANTSGSRPLGPVPLKFLDTIQAGAALPDFLMLPEYQTSYVLARPFLTCGKFNRNVFFDEYKTQFGGILKPEQTIALNQLLDFFEADSETTCLRQIAYMLATTKHETGHTFEPIYERGRKSYFNKYDPVLAATQDQRDKAKRHGNKTKGDGYTYRGRGYVQLTWKDNYKRVGQRLGYGLQFVKNPDLALKPEIAYKIMIYGFKTGVFTGKKLSNYVTDTKKDYYNARKCINGINKDTGKLDHGEDIADYAEKFERTLAASIEK
ncbi:MAG: LysM peptidoglycan-binding domain-containing protein [Gammaproteobacteria bacterium]|nr:MAG: LysM peptidoglycan-binding domain-containing protein [Gammaproteobacteria bacterium]